MSTPPEAEAGVLGVVESLIAAWNAHDPQAFAAAFAADADFTNVFGMHAKGRDAIEQFHAPILKTIFKDSRLTAASTQLRCLRADVATVDVRWEMTGARDPQGNEWPNRRGLLSLVVTREAGDWSIAVMHNMDLDDEEAAEAQRTLQARQ